MQRVGTPYLIHPSFSLNFAVRGEKGPSPPHNGQLPWKARIERAAKGILLYLSFRLSFYKEPLYLNFSEFQEWVNEWGLWGNGNRRKQWEFLNIYIYIHIYLDRFRSMFHALLFICNTNLTRNAILYLATLWGVGKGRKGKMKSLSVGEHFWCINSSILPNPSCHVRFPEDWKVLTRKPLSITSTCL